MSFLCFCLGPFPGFSGALHSHLSKPLLAILCFLSPLLPGWTAISCISCSATFTQAYPFFSEAHPLLPSPTSSSPGPLLSLRPHRYLRVLCPSSDHQFNSLVEYAALACSWQLLSTRCIKEPSRDSVDAWTLVRALYLSSPTALSLPLFQVT